MKNVISYLREILTFVRMTLLWFSKCGLRPHLLNSSTVMLSRVIGISISLYKDDIK